MSSQVPPHWQYSASCDAYWDKRDRIWRCKDGTPVDTLAQVPSLEELTHTEADRVMGAPTGPSIEELVDTGVLSAKGRAVPTHPGRPSDVEFERELVAKGLTAPRVTPAHIESIIAGEYYFTALQGSRCSALDSAVDNGTPLHLPMPLVPALGLLTFCVLVLKNGFTVAGESACASPENFNAEAGRKAARNNAIGKIWPLEGYLLKQRLHEDYSIAVTRDA